MPPFRCAASVAVMAAMIGVLVGCADVVIDAVVPPGDGGSTTPVTLPGLTAVLAAALRALAEDRPAGNALLRAFVRAAAGGG